MHFPTLYASSLIAVTTVVKNSSWSSSKHRITVSCLKCCEYILTFLRHVLNQKKKKKIEDNYRNSIKYKKKKQLQSNERRQIKKSKKIK